MWDRPGDLWAELEQQVPGLDWSNDYGWRKLRLCLNQSHARVAEQTRGILRLFLGERRPDLLHEIFDDGMINITQPPDEIISRIRVNFRKVVERAY